MPRKQRVEVPKLPTRRSTNACKYTQAIVVSREKLNVTLRTVRIKACRRSDSNCIYDVTPDGIPRGAEYVSSLEERVASLEDTIRQSNVIIEEQKLALAGYNIRNTFQAVGPFPPETGLTGTEIPNESGDGCTLSNRTTCSSLHKQQSTNSGATRNQHKVIESPHDGVTIFSFLLHHKSSFPIALAGMPDLPQIQVGDSLINSAYLYTQARYCLVDWVQVEKWHESRETVCYATEANDGDTRAGAFFIWMLYAIGVQLTSSSEHCSQTYFACAAQHLAPVLSQQNVIAVQALLILIQYFYRASGGPSMWSLVGAAMRLCIELGLHRKSMSLSNASKQDPYNVELGKRLFWSAYCFDRSISIVSKRPFGIGDADITVEMPLDIDVTCMDREIIQRLQGLPSVQPYETSRNRVSTMTSALHHLGMYRLQSRAMSFIAKLHASEFNYQGVQDLLAELDDRKLKALHQQYPAGYPQQSLERIEAAYYLIAILLMRPLLILPNTPVQFIGQCAAIAADSCENQKALCFNTETHTSSIRIYQCFRSGLTLLQCLAMRPTIIPLRRSLRAINSCSSALAVYTGTLGIAKPYLQLFEKLADYFLIYADDHTLGSSPHNLRSLLEDITSCEPAAIPAFLNSLSKETNYHQLQDMAQIDPEGHDPLLDPQSDQELVSSMGLDLMLPFETLDEMLRPDTFQQGMVDFWNAPQTR